jgi:outer membrane protein OmpA-like peptidoglycan-associated protein
VPHRPPSIDLIPIPANPGAYRGPRKFTKALNHSYTGVVAPPADGVRSRLRAGRAAVLWDRAMFATGTARLTARGRASVRHLAGLLVRGGTVRCEGYTDYAGQPRRLKSLSQRRAAAVCAALVGYGAKVRFTTAGYGGQHPVVVGGTPAVRLENQRVVVIVTR